MAFKVTEVLPPVEWPVKLPEPTHGGKQKLHEVSFTFKQYRDEELKAAYKAKSKKAFLLDAIVGWSGFVDDDGKEITFSMEMLEQVISIGWVREAAFDAHTAMTLGIVEKN